MLLILFCCKVVFTVSVSSLTQRLFGRKVEHFEVVRTLLVNNSFDLLWHCGRAVKNNAPFHGGLNVSFGMMASFHKCSLTNEKKALFSLGCTVWYLLC